jgi:excisionase family DNA binding protein
MTAAEAAKVASVTTRTITRLCIDGSLPAVKIGNQWRINRKKFMQLIGLA